MSANNAVDKLKLKRAFSQSSASYDHVAHLQREVGRELITFMDSLALQGVVIDLGCGTGFLSAEFLVARPDTRQLIALDIALPMLKHAQLKLQEVSSVQYLCADIEQIPLQNQSVAQCISNLAVQWCRFPQPVFADIYRMLKPEGYFVFSTFGASTLQELKAAWAQVDAFSHVNDFYTHTELLAMLTTAGFVDVRMQRRVYSVTYESVVQLMHELKQLGAHNILAGRQRSLTSKSALKKMLSAYATNDLGKIIATFDVILFSAKR
ncbi:MAG: malonyl-ACP O-methyltransferase BioC [Methylovulum sp.]|jgi:malonyl-CoA O-methyltransferase